MDLELRDMQINVSELALNEVDGLVVDQGIQNEILSLLAAAEEQETLLNEGTAAAIEAISTETEEIIETVTAPEVTTDATVDTTASVDTATTDGTTATTTDASVTTDSTVLAQSSSDLQSQLSQQEALNLQLTQLILSLQK